MNWAGLALTPLDEGDLDKVHAWQNDPGVRDLIMGFRGPIRRETTAQWIATLADQNLKSRAVFAVRLDGALKGVAQIHSIDWVQRTGQLGIYIGEPGERGAGLGHMATALVLDYAFAGLDLARVGLEVIADNAAARRLYERLGFTHEGTLRSAYLQAGVRKDVALYGLLQAEAAVLGLPANARRLVCPA